MKLSEIITTWHKLSSGEPVDQSNIFFKFIAIWIAFNGIYCARYDDEPTEPRKIKKCAWEPEIIDKHRWLVDNDSHYRDALQCIADKGVINLDRPDEVYTIKNLKESGVVMRCVYQIRNNLFHSGKIPGNQRDETLVDAAFTIVSVLFESWFDPNWLDSWAEKESHSAYDTTLKIS